MNKTSTFLWKTQKWFYLRYIYFFLSVNTKMSNITLKVPVWNDRRLWQVRISYIMPLISNFQIFIITLYKTLGYWRWSLMLSKPNDNTDDWSMKYWTIQAETRNKYTCMKLENGYLVNFIWKDYSCKMLHIPMYKSNYYKSSMYLCIRIQNCWLTALTITSSIYTFLDIEQSISSFQFRAILHHIISSAPIRRPLNG